MAMCRWMIGLLVLLVCCSSAAAVSLHDAQAQELSDQSIKAILSGADLPAEISKLRQALVDLDPDAALDTRLQLHGALSLAYFYQRDLDGQKQQADILMQLTEGMETLWRADAIGIRASYLAEMGRADEALALTEQELAIRRKLPRATSKLSNALINIGIAYAELGYLELAMERLEEALDFALEYEADSEVPDMVRTNIGYVLGVGKQYGRAVAINEQVVASGRVVSPNTAVLANRLSNLAKMQMAIGLYEKAEQALIEANAILLNVAPESIDRARTLAGLADIARYQKDWATAINHSRQSWQLSIQLAPDSLYECIAGRLLSEVLLQQPRPTPEQLLEAQRILDRIEPLSQRLLPASAERSLILHAYGLLAYQQGHTAVAIDRLEAAVAVLNMQYALLGNGLLTQASFSAAFADLFDLLAAIYLETRQPAAAIATWDDFRRRQVDDRLQLDNVLQQTPGGRAYLQARQALREQASAVIGSMQGMNIDVADFIAHRQQLVSLVTEQDTLVARSIAANPRLGLLLGRSEEGLGQALTALSEPLVYYALGKTASHAVVVQPGQSEADQLKVFELPEREQIREASARFHVLLESGDSSLEVVQEAAAVLHSMLWQPFAENLVDARFVTIVADDVLHGLPFVALFDQDRGQYLLEQHTLSAATSLRDAFSAQSSVLPNSGRYAGVAYSSGSVAGAELVQDLETRRNASGGSLEPLRFAASEVRKAAALFAPRAQVLLEQQATEPAVYALNDVDVAHFAAHFVVDHTEPLNSYLALSPGAGEDGELRLGEVMQNLRLGAQLAVLSACDSAVGPLYAGEGFIGLSKAFAYAGADQVLATLWPVVDGISAQVMDQFYQGLASGEPIAQALQGAQLRALQGRLRSPDGAVSFWQRMRAWWRGDAEISNTSHPYYWAPYVLTQNRTFR